MDIAKAGWQGTQDKRDFSFIQKWPRGFASGYLCGKVDSFEALFGSKGISHYKVYLNKIQGHQNRLLIPTDIPCDQCIDHVVKV